MEAKYLKVTIHDNDFTNHADIIGNTIQDIFIYEGKYPDENDLLKIKKYISGLWYEIYNIGIYLRWKDTPDHLKETPLEMFERRIGLEIVEYNDIPDWNNCEDIYIPLFDCSTEILYR